MLALVIGLSVAVALLIVALAITERHRLEWRTVAFNYLRAVEALETAMLEDANGSVHRAPNGRFTSAKGKD